MLPSPARRPSSTYRLQFTPQFNFEQGRRIVPYLAQLGITEVYASPLFQASAASSHGYDVNDYNSVSISLGGREGLDRLSEELRRHNLGLLLDFVPNHMGIDGEYNYWWRHVLENGNQSKYAPFFDIEWHPRLERLNDRVLVPMLDKHYGVVLESGRFKLRYENDRFLIQYESLKLPIRPQTYRVIFGRIDEALPSGDARKSHLRELAEAFESLDPHDPQLRNRQFDELRAQWTALLSGDPLLQTLLNNTLTEINGIPGNPPSFIALHELLENQHYRLAHWKVGAHEVNYRRFFAVDTLIGLKMENFEVFEAAHQLLAELIAANTITGIRLDHIDGLWNPAEYLGRLEKLVQRKQPNARLWTLVEKILAPNESLVETWPVHGTSGYEFAASLIGLFLDHRDEAAWTRLYEKFTGETKTSRELTYEDKLFALEEIFPNAVNNLAVELDSLIEPDWHRRDFSLHDLKTSLRHLLASLPVYRTYRMPGERMRPEEVRWIDQAVEEGIRRNPCIDPNPLRFVGSVITGEYPTADNPIEKQGFMRWVCKLQQATGAVMAKSVEDTHFFRYVRMLGANEVGSHPARFGEPVASFHEANRLRLEQAPFCMLTTSTHDTKMSEDARARLFALAELPGEWETHLNIWHRINVTARKEIDGKFAPDPREEYLLYQALLAAWPLGCHKADDNFRQRLKSYFRKAQGEAKLNTSWTFPHESWHAAGATFIDSLLDSTDFMGNFLPFAHRIAQRGMIFSLAQAVLRLTAPGIPDLYQGNESWDFSLVDPDNRRPVDYDSLIDTLSGLEKRSPADLLANWQDGGLKVKVVQSLLRCRNQIPELFHKGEYICLETEGEKAGSLVAFVRKFNSHELMVVVPRRLDRVDNSWLGSFWDNTRLHYSMPRTCKNLFTGTNVNKRDDSFLISDILSDLPVAALISS